MTTAIDGIECVTFDCYGTLIDWESGLGSFLYAFALQQGDEAPGPGRIMREEWESIQFELLQETYRPYEEILTESLRLFSDRRGYTCSSDDGRALADSMRSWQPFHDTVPVLAEVAGRGVRLAIISNTDHSLIAHSLNQMRIEFDEVITAEDCLAYKPSPTVFEQALDRLQTTSANMLHVAFGFKYDIGPASELGWRTAWVNRNNDTLEGTVEPDHTWKDLWGLAELSAPASDD